MTTQKVERKRLFFVSSVVLESIEWKEHLKQKRNMRTSFLGADAVFCRS